MGGRGRRREGRGGDAQSLPLKEEGGIGVGLWGGVKLGWGVSSDYSQTIFNAGVFL